MGLFDRLTFEDDLDVEVPDIGADPFEITWQTKSITRHQPMMENYKVTAEGRLFKEEAEYEHVPEEERPGYNEEIGGFENEVERGRGSRKKIIRVGRIQSTTECLSFTGPSMATTSASKRSSLMASW